MLASFPQIGIVMVWGIHLATGCQQCWFLALWEAGSRLSPSFCWFQAELKQEKPVRTRLRGLLFQATAAFRAGVLEGLFLSVLLTLGDIRILTKPLEKQGGGAE